MPKTINPAAKWTDQIDVPRAGEGVKATGVELPFSDVLANTKQLKNLLADLQMRVDGLQVISSTDSNIDLVPLNTAVSALDTRVDQLESAATSGNSAGITAALNDLNTGLAVLTTRVAAVENMSNDSANPADFYFIPTYHGGSPHAFWFTIMPRTILKNANYMWRVTTLGAASGTLTGNFSGEVMMTDVAYRPTDFSSISATLTVTTSDGKVYTMTKSFPSLATYVN